MPHREPYIIAYDISCPRRQHRARKLLRGYSTGGQKSLFECWLTQKELQNLYATLSAELQTQTDRLHIFHLTENTEARLLGKAQALANITLLMI